MAKLVVAFGEVLWDLLPSGAVLGGAPGNFACRVNGLGNRGIIASALGKDDLGRKALARLKELGMETEFIQRNDHPSGTVPVTVDKNGQPGFSITPGTAYDYMEPAKPLLALAAETDCICFGTLIQRNARSRETLYKLLDASRPDALRLLDINLRKDCYNRENIVRSLRRAGILKLNEEEAAELDVMLNLGGGGLPETGRELAEKFSLTECVITLGERGALWVSRPEQSVYAPGYKVKTADTCGSGDAFTAGFLHLRLRGRPPAECCRLGNALGAVVATQHGATAPVDPEEIDRHLQGRSRRLVDPRFEAATAPETDGMEWKI